MLVVVALWQRLEAERKAAEAEAEAEWKKVQDEAHRLEEVSPLRTAFLPSFLSLERRAVVAMS